jgi:hypothetical protein
MAYPAFRATDQPFNGRQPFDFGNLAFSPHDKYALAVEMHSRTS